MDEAIAIFKKLTNENKKNFYLRKILRKQRPFPHNQIYSSAVSTTNKQLSIKNKPEARIITAGFSTHKRITAIASFITLIIYFTKPSNKLLRLFKRAFNISSNIVVANNLNTSELVNLVVGTSTISPFIKIRKFNSEFMIDGVHSLITPIQALDDCQQILAIHTTNYQTTDLKNIHISPLNKIKENPLNYAGSESFIKIFNQGYTEAATHYETIKDSEFFS